MNYSLKKINSQHIAFAIGGILLLLLLSFAVSNRGELFQGNLQLGHFAADQSEGARMKLLAPSNQLREGVNSVLKMSVQAKKPLTVTKLKLHFGLKDLALGNFKMTLNDKDMTELLTPETVNTLKDSLNAGNGRNLNKTFVLAFQKGLALKEGENTLEFMVNTQFLSLQSVIISSVVDMMITDNGKETVIAGPLEKIKLETAYTRLK